MDLQPGRHLGRRYIVEARLGVGSEGEVYQIRERDTDICRAAKVYYPYGRTNRIGLAKHAQKLNLLRHYPIVLQYHHSEILYVRGQEAVVLISDLCEDEPLENWIARHPGKRLRPYVAPHILFNLARGLDVIHVLGEYHADVHSQNILIKPTGVRFDLTLIDFYDWGRPTRAKQQQDIRDAITVFHECLGGPEHYAKLPKDLKYIIAGMRRHDMLKRFPTMTALRRHLETFKWNDLI